MEVYTNKTENAFIYDGKLIIKAIKTSGGYTSARIKSQGLQHWEPMTHAKKIVARMKLPYGQGIWPAFWLLGEKISSDNWPKCGEIDIMELIGGGTGRDDTLYGTCHWDNSGHASSGGNTKLGGNAFFYQDYHTFEIEWSATQIIWKLDGNQYFTKDMASDASMSELHDATNPFFIILNIAVGGSWPGNPNSSTMFPQYLIVDWVRVYEQ